MATRQNLRALALLRGARERLARPGAWIHGDEPNAREENAFDAEGKGCSPEDPRAVRWDLSGALRAAGTTPEETASNEAWDEAWLRLSDAAGLPRERSPIYLALAVIAWQDAPERTLEDVLALIDRALAADDPDDRLEACLANANAERGLTAGASADLRAALVERKTPPPMPEVTPELLALCARLAFAPLVSLRPGATAHGVFLDEEGRELPLVLTALSPHVAGGAAWGLEGHRACVPFAFDRLTYNVLHEGVAERGAVAWQGRHYRIAAGWDGLRPVAVAMVFTPREPGDPAP